MSGKFLVTYQDAGNSEYGTAILGQFDTLVTNLTSTNFLGTSTAAYTNGQTASIMLKGGISDNQTSLTAGSTYYVQPAGTFATSAGTPSVLAGEAVSATSLLLNGLATPDEIPSQSGNTGKFLTTNGSAASWGTVGGLTLATPVATTSGTSVTFTGLPSGIKRITVLLNGVSTNGTGEKLITIGDSGGLETSGYVSAGGRIVSTSPEVGYAGTGFILYSTRSSGVINGGIVLALENAATNTWIAYGTAGASTNASFIISGKKSLSAELTQLSFSMTPDSFDAGEINISYE